MATLLFYDFEVFSHDWLVVIINAKTKEEHFFINDTDGFIKFYNQHKQDIWVGYNSRHYDQYVAKAIIQGALSTWGKRVEIRAKEGNSNLPS